MKENFIKYVFLFLTIFVGVKTSAQVVTEKADSSKASTNNLSLKERQLLGLTPSVNPFFPRPGNMKTIVEYDAKNKRYIVKELIGDTYVTQTKYLTISEYQKYLKLRCYKRKRKVIKNA